MTNKLTHDEIRALIKDIKQEYTYEPMLADLVIATRQLLTEIEQLKQENKIKADAGAGLVKTAKTLLKENEQLKQEKAEQIEAAYKEGRREDLDYDDYSEKDIDEFWQSSQAYRKVKDENR